MKKKTLLPKAVRVGKVVQFLKRNPLSTSEEVFNATGVGVMTASKYVRMKRIGDKVVWRVNHRKLGINLGNSAH